jgi:hypothetical protein
MPVNCIYSNKKAAQLSQSGFATHWGIESVLKIYISQQLNESRLSNL